MACDNRVSSAAFEIPSLVGGSREARDWSAVLGSALWFGACSTRTYDLVIANGHVMDPESGFDRVAHVGIVGNRIETISDDPLRGTRTIDATGLVVAPGLIELHTHGEDKLNYEFRAMDGVTTMLDTERGTVDVDKWYADRDRKTLVNYGISAGHPAARVQVVGGKYEGFHFSGPALQRGNARTDRTSRRARPPRAHARRARRRPDALLHAGGN